MVVGETHRVAGYLVPLWIQDFRSIHGNALTQSSTISAWECRCSSSENIWMPRDTWCAGCRFFHSGHDLVVYLQILPMAHGRSRRHSERGSMYHLSSLSLSRTEVIQRKMQSVRRRCDDSTACDCFTALLFTCPPVCPPACLPAGLVYTPAVQIKQLVWQRTMGDISKLLDDP